MRALKVYKAHDGSDYRRKELMQWQPIETAPRDKNIIVFGEGCDSGYEAWWDGFSWMVMDQDNLEPPTELCTNVTHWMPLPEPPNPAARTVAPKR
jgi:hypothetical protein